MTAANDFVISELAFGNEVLNGSVICVSDFPLDIVSIILLNITQNNSLVSRLNLHYLQSHPGQCSSFPSLSMFRRNAHI